MSDFRSKTIANLREKGVNNPEAAFEKLARDEGLDPKTGYSKNSLLLMAKEAAEKDANEYADMLEKVPIE